MIHIYCGDGKGKTTAACGLAVRASGCGMKVLFAQFFKCGNSSEILQMEKLDRIDTLHFNKHLGRNKNADEKGKTETSDAYCEMMEQIYEIAGNYDMIVLDEVILAYNYGVLDSQEVLSFLHDFRDTHEIVLTGRNPAQAMLDLADYVTEMKKIKHPYDHGITARRGIEY